jgi:hypothetical protein
MQLSFESWSKIWSCLLEVFFLVAVDVYGDFILHQLYKMRNAFNFTAVGRL